MLETWTKTVRMVTIRAEKNGVAENEIIVQEILHFLKQVVTLIRITRSESHDFHFRSFGQSPGY